jgi:hypothetical protein
MPNIIPRIKQWFKKYCDPLKVRQVIILVAEGTSLPDSLRLKTGFSFQVIRLRSPVPDWQIIYDDIKAIPWLSQSVIILYTRAPALMINAGEDNTRQAAKLCLDLLAAKKGILVSHFHQPFESRMKIAYTPVLKSTPAWHYEDVNTLFRLAQE